MKFVKVRECDGQCCRKVPRFPNAEGTDCIYHTDSGPTGCAIQRGDMTIKNPDAPSLHYPDTMTNQQIFDQTCVPWPHLHTEGRDTDGCCWKWLDG